MLNLAPFFVRFWLLWCLFGAFFRVVFAKFVANLPRMRNHFAFQGSSASSTCFPAFAPLHAAIRPVSSSKRSSVMASNSRFRREFGHGVELALQEPGHRLAVDDRLAGLLGHIEAALGGGKVAFVIFGETHQCGAPILVIQQFLLPFLKFQIFKIFKAAFSLYLYKVFFSFVFIFFYFICPGFASDFPIFASVLLVVAVFLSRFSSFSKVKLSLLF